MYLNRILMDAVGSNSPVEERKKVSPEKAKSVGGDYVGRKL